MKFSIIKITPSEIVVAARAEGDGMIGDIFRSISPGGSFFEIPFDQLSKLGIGEHSLPPKK